MRSLIARQCVVGGLTFLQSIQLQQLLLPRYMKHHEKRGRILLVVGRISEIPAAVQKITPWLPLRIATDIHCLH